MKKILLFLLIFPVSGLTQKVAERISENNRSQYQIDWNYKAGEYLLFNCERKHFACVNLEGFHHCSEERKYAIENKMAILPCAPLKKFSEKKLCVEKNYQVVDQNAMKRFCYPK
jgi:hypothetical protein